MNPIEFINLGQKIYEDKNYSEDPRYRTVINRIYYGIIHLTKDVKKIGHVNIKQFHSEIIQKLKDVDMILGSYVANLKKYREDADYYLKRKISKVNVEEFLLFFKKIMENLENEGLI